MQKMLIYIEIIAYILHIVYFILWHEVFIAAV